MAVVRTDRGKGQPKGPAVAKRRNHVTESRRSRARSGGSPPGGASPTTVAAAAWLSEAPSIPTEQVRAILNGLADAVIVTDPEGRLVLSNQAVERVLPPGLTAIAVSEWSAYGGFLGPDMHTPVAAEELPPVRSLRGEVVDDCEIYVPGTGDPGDRWISVSSRPVIDSHGRIVGSVTAVRDISGRRQQLERHHLMSKIVEETADAVLVTDGAGNIVYVNAAFERSTGYSRVEVLGENPRLLKSGMHSSSFYEELWTRLLGGEVYRGTLIDRRKNGEVYLSSQTITPLRTPGGAISHMVSIARDLSDRRENAER
jgi:PAS domain S-box-containing protein